MNCVLTYNSTFKSNSSTTRKKSVIVSVASNSAAFLPRAVSVR